jgi:hypothetical protein
MTSRVSEAERKDLASGASAYLMTMELRTLQHPNGGTAAGRRRCFPLMFHHLKAIDPSFVNLVGTITRYA